MEKTPGYVVVETGGIGYGVSLPLSSYYALPEPGAKVSLLTHTLLREDSLTLVGFVTKEEKKMFTFLMSVTGIGPKLAVSILSGISVADLANSINDENSTKISSTPGVGKKMAMRIILELKDKINGSELDAISGSGVTRSVSREGDDAKSALIALGYKEAVAQKAVDKTLKYAGEELTVEEIIKESLKSLVR